MKPRGPIHYAISKGADVGVGIAIGLAALLMSLAMVHLSVP
jgi:hypothetical protein